MFRVIEGKYEETQKKLKKQKEKKLNLYFNAFSRKIVSYEYSDLLCAIFYGIKYVNIYDLNTNTNYIELKRLFDFIQLLKLKMRYVIINDLINIFPIIKEYNGNKFECKDYYSTLEYLLKINKDKCLFEEIDEFLWNYYNRDLMNFSIKELLVLDKLRKLRGETGILEGFTDMLGVDSYIINKEEGYIYNRNTEEITEFKPCFPKYLKVVKDKE